MVGHDQVLQAEGHGGAGHGLDGGATVAPGGVGVAIALDGGSQLRTVAERDGRLGLESSDAIGHATLERLDDDLAGACTHRWQLEERAVGDASLQLAGRKLPHHIGGAQEGRGLLRGQEASVL